MVYTSASIIAGAHDDVIVAGNTVKFWLSAAEVVAKEMERLLGNEHWGVRLLLLRADGQPRDFKIYDIKKWADIGKFLENFEYIKDFIDYTVGNK